MDSEILFIFIIIGILAGVGLVLNPVESAIPPTPAISMINTTSGNVTAMQYNSFVEFVEGSGITITPNYLLNEITFTATGGGGINNTISSIGTQQSIVSGQVLIDHQLKGIACGGDLICSNNSTDVTISFTETGMGLVALDDLTDVIITSPAYLSTLFYDGVNWIDMIFSIHSKTCSAGQFVSDINNQTGVVTCSTPSGSGNMTVLGDAGDVTITSPSQLSVLYYVGSQWIDKIFSVNTQSASNDIFITGINNQTGVITTNQFSVNTQSSAVDRQITGINNVTGEITRNTFSVNTIDCGTEAVKSIDNATGNVTCIAVGGGTARESMVADWTVDSTKSNIGTSFVNVYTTGIGDPQRIDTNGKTTVTLIIDWTKVGAGTQKCIITSTTTANRDLISFANLVSGLNTNATFDIPANRENIIDTYKPQCKSTTSTDDPVWLTGQVLLR